MSLPSTIVFLWRQTDSTKWNNFDLEEMQVFQLRSEEWSNADEMTISSTTRYSTISRAWKQTLQKYPEPVSKSFEDSKLGQHHPVQRRKDDR